jgi:hypothetical protein
MSQRNCGKRKRKSTGSESASGEKIIKKNQREKSTPQNWLYTPLG